MMVEEIEMEKKWKKDFFFCSEVGASGKASTPPLFSIGICSHRGQEAVAAQCHFPNEIRQFSVAVTTTVFSSANGVITAIDEMHRLSMQLLAMGIDLCWFNCQPTRPSITQEKSLRKEDKVDLWVSLAREIKTFATKMVITSGNDEDRGGQEKESKEESVLAMLGIIGTILNLIVIIFVYIYTTL
ncbi:hypothetical protein STEG23_013918 [Scotinomys teguina]